MLTSAVTKCSDASVGAWVDISPVSLVDRTVIEETLKKREAEFTVIVVRRWLEAEGVVAVEVGMPDGSDLPNWEPGAHVDVRVAEGMYRQYSLCGDHGVQKTWRIGVRLEEQGRGGSRWIHEQVRPGGTLNLRGPRSHFPFDPAESYLFLAGGIGITPILPMAAAARAAGASYTIVYCGRARGSMGFLRDVEAHGANARIQPRDEFGRVDIDAILSDLDPATLVYCCGPAGLLDALDGSAERLPAGAIRTERFCPKVQDADLPMTAFKVELARSGRVLEVPADKTLLSVLEAAGADVVSSCGEGTCGACVCPVLAGALDHRDSVLTDEERAAGDGIIVCVSRCRGTLVLDL